jgi:pilus assembly protein CpaF
MTICIKTPDGLRERTVGEGASLSVGRLRDCDICLPEREVSRRHATFSCRGGKLFVRDDGSHFGTFLNGFRLEQEEEVKGDGEVRIASASITVKDGSGGKRPEPAAPAAPAAAGNANFRELFKDATILYSDRMMAIKSRIHMAILARLNAGENALMKRDDKELAFKAEQCLDQVMREFLHEFPDGVDMATVRQSLLDELMGYGPISPMIRAPEITEIMVNGPDRVFVESAGILYETGVRFFNERHLIQIIQRIVEPLGRHVDDASPMVDARLPDGSRVNAIIPPLALDGASVTIRKFAEKKLTTADLIGFGSMTEDMALFLEEAVKSRQNILVSGGTGSGKTTLLNILSQFIPEGERVVTVEDSAELKLSHRNIVRLEARPANVEGKGRITIRDLVVNCLRMRPDRIIVGECRGAEALDMLQAMNTGHDGSLTTAHANNPRDALSRLENMVMMAGYDLPSSAIREQMASAIDLIVQQTRMGDGTRKIVKIVEVTGREGDVIQMQDIFEFKQSGVDKKGRILGEYQATGNIPFFIEERRRRGVLGLDMSVFVPKV